MRRRTIAVCLAPGAFGLVLLLGCPDRATVAVGGQSGDEGANVHGAPTDEGMNDDGSSLPMGGPILIPYCSRQESNGPDEGSRYFVCVSEDRRYSEGELNWSDGEPTPPGAYRCDCNQEESLVADASGCPSALEGACHVDFDGPLSCAPPYGTCWPLRDDPGGWRCRCSESAPLVELRADSCEQAAFTTCNAGECSDDTGRCAPRADGVGHDCECATGELVAWPAVWDCRAALSTCAPSCTSGSGGCSLRDGGHSCQCTGAAGASHSNERVAPLDPKGAGADAGSADAGTPAWTLVPDADTYGLCRQGLELTCGPPPAGETCHEEDEHGIATCTSDGAGAWDCDCRGRPTHVTHKCPEPPGTIAGSGAPFGGLPAPRDRSEIPDDVERRLFTCMDAVFDCGCE